MKKRQDQLWFIYGYCLCGIFACLWAATYILELEYSIPEVCLFITGFGLLLCFLRQKLHLRLFLFYIPFGVGILIFWRRLAVECLIVANTVLRLIYDYHGVSLGAGYSIAKNQSDTTHIVFIGIGLITVLFFHIAFSTKKIYFPLILILPIVIGGVLIGKEPPVGVVFLFMLFYAGLCAIKTGKKKYAAVSGIAAGIFVTALFGVSRLLSGQSMLEVSNTNAVFLLDEATHFFSGKRSGGEINGVVSRRSRTASEQEKLSVTISDRIEEPLYLRGFFGETYSRDRWREVNESGFQSEIFDNSQNIIADTENKPYDMIIAEILAENLSEDQAVEISVQPLNKKDDTVYSPYFSIPLDIPFDEETQNRSFGVDDHLKKYYRAYPKKLFDDIASTGSIFDLDDRTPISEAAEAEYEAYVRKKYLAYEPDRFPRLLQLCGQNPMDNERAATDFIQKTLWKNARYTLTPGQMPSDVEIPEYFLFEGHEGYCVHFATTAVLMYRMYGIPARYVSGYMIPAAKFNKQDGIYCADATDTEAHAWVEIYREGIGWYPVEVTPSAGDAVVRTGDSADAADETDLKSEENSPEDSSSDSIEKSQNSSEIETEKKNSQQETSEISTSDPGSELRILRLLRVLIPALVIVILFLSAIYGLQKRRQRLIQKIHALEVRQLFDRLLRLLNSQKLMIGYDGQEEDFTEKFLHEIPDVTEEELTHVMNILYSAAYGNSPISREEHELVFICYKKTAKYLYKKCGKWKRFVFCYLNGLIPF